MQLIREPWPWYVAGPLIGLTIPFLLIIGNKTFGISSSLRHICAACLPANISFFKYDWRKEAWNLFFVAGVLLGSIVAISILSTSEPIVVNDNLRAELATYGVTEISALNPTQLFNFDELFGARGFILMVVGGFMVGFGTRYAGGCTSGHSIMGISNLQIPSIVATCFFMVGGLIASNLLLPIILKL